MLAWGGAGVLEGPQQKLKCKSKSVPEHVVPDVMRYEFNEYDAVLPDEDRTRDQESGVRQVGPLLVFFETSLRHLW